MRLVAQSVCAAVNIRVGPVADSWWAGTVTAVTDLSGKTENQARPTAMVDAHRSGAAIRIQELIWQVEYQKRNLGGRTNFE